MESGGLRAGQTLGSYLLVSEIGRGGMAVVFRARQTSLDRFVALKVLGLDLARDPGYVARFRREATTAAQLDHPNIVPIFDVAESDGHLFIAMRYIAGGSLAQLIQQRGPLSFPHALRLIGQVAGALDYAHARGVVHRDIKPANILLETDGDGACLADFGIARADDSGTRLTRFGTIAGTPEYMAPEQAQGDDVDFRADLYALGIIAYELLSGRVPFEAESGVAVLHKQAYEAPPDLRQFRPDLPVAVHQAIRRMLAKGPGERYASGAAFVAALRGDAPSAQSSPPYVAYSAGPPRASSSAGARRSGPPWIPIGAAAGALAVLIAAVVIASSNSRTSAFEQGPTPPPVAVASNTQAGLAELPTPPPTSLPTPAPTLPPTPAPPSPTATVAAVRPVLTKFEVSPQSAFPGDTITFMYEISNPGSVPVAAVLGATLRPQEGQSDLNDADHDQSISIQPGTGIYKRVFRVPTDAAGGAYDVLWGVMGSDRDTSFALQTVPGGFQIIEPAPTAVPSRTPATTLALTAINEANRVWAAVVDRNGAPVSSLANVYAGRWLDTVRADVQSMRSRGQYRVARLAAPTVLRSATYTSPVTIEAFTSEQWNDRTYNSDEELARVAPGHVEQRYVLQLSGAQWLVVDSQISRSS